MKMTPENFLLLTTNDKLLKRVTESFKIGRRGSSTENPHLAIKADGTVLTHDGRHRALLAQQRGDLLEVDLRYYLGNLSLDEQHERLLIEDMPQEVAWFGEQIKVDKVPEKLTSQYRDLSIPLDLLDKTHGL